MRTETSWIGCKNRWLNIDNEYSNIWRVYEFNSKPMSPCIGNLNLENEIWTKRHLFFSLSVRSVRCLSVKQNRVAEHCFIQSCVFLIWSSREVVILTISQQTVAWPPRIKTLPALHLRSSTNTTLFLSCMPSDVEIFLCHSSISHFSDRIWSMWPLKNDRYSSLTE